MVKVVETAPRPALPDIVVSFMNQTAKEHPEGRHVAEARRAAIASALVAEPPIGKLTTGETVLVDDHVYAPNQIKAITGCDVTKGISRSTMCISRHAPF
jgi:hypothetical protein